MTFQSRAVAMLCLVVILMQQAHFSYGRPQDSSKTQKSNEAERRQDVELTKETQIGDAKVYGLIHNKSEDKDAVQEKEGIHSKILSMYDKVQQKIVNLLNPGAVVDKATAKDYEPNPIEDYEALRLSIVNAVDFFAKQINAALNKPREFFRKANKKFTKTLNDLGSKIIELE
nr:uncharacterized protein LOC109399249 [Aedes albopictus]